MILPPHYRHVLFRLNCVWNCLKFDMKKIRKQKTLKFTTQMLSLINDEPCEGESFIYYLPKIVFRCFNLVAESFLISCILSVDFLMSCGFFVNILYMPQLRDIYFFFDIWFFVRVLQCVICYLLCTRTFIYRQTKMCMCLAQYNIYSYLSLSIYDLYLHTARTTLSHYFFLVSTEFCSDFKFWGSFETLTLRETSYLDGCFRFFAGFSTELQ